MSIGLPGHLRPQIIVRAFARAAHIAAWVALAAAFSVVASVQTEQTELILWPALVALLPIGVLLWQVDRHRTLFMTIAYLAVGGACVFWFSVTVMAQYPLGSTDSFVLSSVRVALMLVGGIGTGILASIGWCVAGLAAAEAAVIGAAYHTGTAIAPDTTSLATFALVVITLIAIRQGLRRSRAVQPVIHRAAEEEELAAMRYRIEAQAAAVMHDTVLGHLAAIRNSPPGPLPAKLREQTERDLQMLIGEEWLSDDVRELDSRGRTEWQASPLFTAVEESRALGLDVEVSGDPAAVGRLDARRGAALGAAAKQCLVNVHRHAGTDHADVVVFGSDTDVSVMIVDDGRGFDVDGTAPDRLGIRESVRRRMQLVGGDVQLWSTPGHGTSVLLRVPTPANDADAEPA